MDYSKRIRDFQERFNNQADVAFFPVASSDLQYFRLKTMPGWCHKGPVLFLSAICQDLGNISKIPF